MYGQPDHACRVRDAALDRLADPPRRVGRELEALAPVELVDGVDEAEVALLHDVEQRQTRALVLLRDRDDEPQVRVHELAVRLLALTDGTTELAPLGGRELLRGLELGARLDAGLDRLREPDLVVLGEEVVAADVLEVQADEVFVVTVLAAGLHVLDGHFFAFLTSEPGGEVRRVGRVASWDQYRPDGLAGRAPWQTPATGEVVPLGLGTAEGRGRRTDPGQSRSRIVPDPRPDLKLEYPV